MPSEQPFENQQPEDKPDPKRFVRLNFGRNPTPESILKAIRQVLEETKDQRAAEGELRLDGWRRSSSPDRPTP